MEKWDAYDVHRRKLGFELVRDEPIPRGALHIAVHMVYYNSNGEILIQRRADSKPLAPGLWAFTGGSVLAGETSRQGCARETEEEMGFAIDPEAAELIISFVDRTCINDIYLIKADVGMENLRLQEEEVADAAWLNRESLLKLMADGEKFYQYSFNELLVRILDGDPRVWGA